MRRLVAMLVVVVLAGCVTSSQLQQASASEFSKMREELTVSASATDRAFVQCVADALIAELNEPYSSINWDLELFEEEDINAFAMPGGQIGVYTGLFKTATNQHQLAAVMGHEIAHVTRGHSLKRANTQQAATLGVVVGSIASEAVRDNAGLIVLGAQLGLLLPYGRSQESEADIYGLDLMAKAGFDPGESVELWRNMAAENKSAVPQFMSTHPSSQTRIRDLQARLNRVEPVYQQARAQGKRPNCNR